MMENGFSSPRNDTFPAGLRVLVVDDDPTWLKILEKMLKKCSYEVTTRGLARDALSLLRERKDGYDIVISDVNMPDMDGFKLLEHVGLEMDLPVIMMSVDGETSRVMKGVQHGACDYLLKPIRMKELRNIWQHVFRKKIHEIRDIESHESFEAFYMMRNGSDHSDDGHLLSMEDLTSVKKRKDIENKHDDKDFGDASSTKKSRVVWSVDLHQKFVRAVNQIGFDKVGPKKILDLMNVPWLTRENVASHLQKYRLYLSRLQKEKENDLKSSFGGMKHSDVSPNDPSGSFGLQNSVNTHQNDVVNGSYGFSVSNLLVQNVDPNNKHEGESLVSESKAETKRASTSHLPDPHKTKNSQMVFNHSFASLESEVNLTAFDSTIPTNYSWSEVPEMEFKQEHKPLIPLENGFSKLPVLDPPHHIHVDQLQSMSSVSSKPSSVDRGITGPINNKPQKGEYGSSQVNCVTSTVSTSDSFQTKSNMVNHQALEPIYASTCSMKTQGFNQSSITDLESTQRNQTLVNGSPFVSFDDELQVLFQGDSYGMNIGLHNVEFPEYNAQGLIDEVPFHLYDSLRPGYEYSCDTTEYSVLDQRLFIA